MKKNILTLVSISMILLSCSKESNLEPNLVPVQNYLTKNVIVVVMDGPRYSETWGDSSHEYIPYMANFLAQKGVINSQFRNNGSTYTVPGHTAITTGNYENILNNGSEIPTYPSIFQHWRKAKSKDSLSAWLITSKDKLEVLSNCETDDWSDSFQPATNCGFDGLGTGNRDDLVTFEKTLDHLVEYKPQLALIQFKEPDFSGHQNDWNNYLQGIIDVDRYIYNLWTFLENDPYYEGSTTMIVTNDHGRHLDNIGDGFRSHGDDCEGCQHINFYAFGPDFKEDVIEETPRELIDISATIAELLDFELPFGNGEIMHELFK